MGLEDDPQHTFDWEGTPPPDPAALPELVIEEVKPRRVSPRALLGGAGAAAVIAVAVVVLAGGGGSGPSGSGPIALAADATTHEPGYKFDMTMTATADGQTVNFNGSGAISTGPPLSGSFTATVAGVTVNERIIGTDLYLQSPTIGAQWEHLSVAGLSGLSGGGGSTQLTSADPAQMLQYLRASGTVTNEGPQTLNGIVTTHYHADIDLSQYAATLPAAQQAAAQQAVAAYEKATGSSTLPIDVWIDNSNLVRQLGIDLSVPGGSGDVSVDLSMSLFDYGPQAAVSLPPAGDVTELPGQSPASTPGVPAAGGASVPAARPNAPD